MPVATNELMNRSRAVTEIADQILDRTGYVIVTPTYNLARLVDGLAAQTAKWTAYLDSGSDMVLRTPYAGTVRAVEVFMDTAAVITVPKTVPASALTAALGQHIPEDGSQDIVIFRVPDEPVFFPMLFVDALDLVDPKVSAMLRANQVRSLN